MTMAFQRPISGHSAHHDTLGTFVETRVPSQISVVIISTTVSDGVPSRTTIAQPGFAKVGIAVSELPELAEYVQAHEENVARVVERHEAALTALGESWALDTSVDPEHVEVGA